MVNLLLLQLKVGSREHGIRDPIRGVADNAERFACSLNLFELERELERLVLAFSRRKSFCVREFVEIVEDKNQQQSKSTP